MLGRCLGLHMGHLLSGSVTILSSDVCMCVYIYIYTYTYLYAICVIGILAAFCEMGNSGSIH